MAERIAIIHWIDAALHGQDTKFERDIKELGLVTLISSGIVVSEDGEQITLCMDRNIVDNSWRGLGTIPKSGIKSIKYIEISEDDNVTR